MMRRINTIILSLLLCFILVACSFPGNLSKFAKKSETNSTTEEVTVTPPEEIEFKALTSIEEGRPNVYLLVKLLDSNYWATLTDGAIAASEDLGCNLYYAGTENENDWQLQANMVEAAVNNGADAIVFGPNDSVRLSPYIDKVHDKGIAVVLVDTVANTDNYDICYMTDNLQAGHTAGRAMLEELKAAGHPEAEELTVAIVVGTSVSQTINARLAGFYQYWSSYAPKTWTIIPHIGNCDAVIQAAEDITLDFMDENENLAGVFSTNNIPTRGVCSAIIKSGRTDIATVGFDYSDEIETLLMDKKFHSATVLQRQYEMGYKGVSSALDIINGTEITTKFVDTGIAVLNNSEMDSPETQEMLSHY